MPSLSYDVVLFKFSLLLSSSDERLRGEAYIVVVVSKKHIVVIINKKNIPGLLSIMVVDPLTHQVGGGDDGHCR
jgi:hypothetical protein